SYGAVNALCAAGLRPQAVRSLTVSEPGCLRAAAGDPLGDQSIENGERLFAHAGALGPVEVPRMFRGGAGVTREAPQPLPAGLPRGAELLMRERPSWEAEPPWATLRDAPFPKLVISGDHSPVFKAVCDAVAQLTAARRETVAGRDHTIPATGEPYNALLEEF